ncbi:MAG: hypothetical protein OEX02_19730, partial [Cyclobacteriaceae bacterium]|nr:hypothetical protein [Cyclobacteriaceae bacterium]
TISPNGNIGNAVGSFQGDQFNSHSHGISTYTGTASGYRRSYTLWGFDANITGQTGNSGGTETRPKNAYVNYIIKY